MKMHVAVVGIAIAFISTQAAAQQWNPRPGWKDSYAVDGVCYCDSNGFDHGADELTYDTPIGELSVVQICADITSVLGVGPTSGRIPYNDLQCGNGPPNNAGDEDPDACPGRVDIGSAGCLQLGPKWNLEAVYTPDAIPTPSPPSPPTPIPTKRTLVQIIKSDSPGFAIDGRNGASDGQNVHLWTANPNNINQQWIEIDRGNGYFSYRKQNTVYCLAGGAGGSNGKNVVLRRCGARNQNQHWQRVDTGTGSIQLRKRSSPGFALDGGNGGSPGQNVSQYDSSSSSTNLQWTISAL